MEREEASTRSARRAAVTSILLLAPWLGATASAQELSLTPYKPGGIYRTGETVGWTVRGNAGRYSYEIRKDNFEVVGRGTIDTERPTNIEAGLDVPGMLFLEINAEAGETPPGDRPPIVAGAAVSPERIQPSAPEPEDFDRFWAEKLAELARVPMQAVLTPKPSGHPDLEYFTIRLDHLDGRGIHGQLAKPKGRGPFPALVIFQWAGRPYPLQKSWVTDRAAEGWLVLNIQPHDVPPDAPQPFYDELPQSLKNYERIGRDNRDRSYFLAMYLASYRAVEYIASRPDWNGRTLVVTGTSMGGQQSLCTAALNRRVTALLVHVPAGADALGPLHGRASGYPNWPVQDPRVAATAPYFDTVNCASRIRVPALVSMGFVDTDTPPVGIWAAFNRISGPKEAVPLVDAAHNHRATREQQMPWLSRSEEWLRMLAAGRDPLEPEDVPAPRLDESSHRAHEALLRKRTQGKIDVYFLGDSITRRWGASDPQYRHLLEHWNASFRGWNAANFGWGGDRTQNILWRLGHGELDGVHPKVIVLMAGTNNVGSVTPLDVEARVGSITRGIQAILDACRKKAPGATILLMGITPRNDNLAVMPVIDGVNARLARLADGKSIRYLDLNGRLADEHGRLFEGMTDPDGLHFTVQAYQVWADALKPELTRLLGVPASVDLAPPPTGDPGALSATGAR